MKNWSEYVFFIIVGILSIGLTIGITVFSVVPTSYIITNPTENQMQELLRGDSNNRIWVQDAHQVYQGSSIIIVTINTRNCETDRIESFLNQLGVNYEKQNK
jgi:hypothetical protein